MYTIIFIGITLLVVTSKQMIRDEVEFIDKNDRTSAFNCSQSSDFSVRCYDEDL